MRLIQLNIYFIQSSALFVTSILRKARCWLVREYCLSCAYSCISHQSRGT